MAGTVALTLTAPAPVTVSFREMAAWAAWATKNGVALASVIPQLQAIGTAEGLDAKWAAFKSAGDLVVPIIGDCPALQYLTTGDEPMEQPQFDENIIRLKASPPAKALPPGTIELILSNLPMIISSIQQIVAFFKSHTKPTPAPATA